MRKVIAMILFVFLFFSVTISYAAITVPQDVVDTEFEADVSLLMELGIMSINAEGTFKPYDKISRADFIKLMFDLLNVGDVSGSTNFKDIPQDHPASKAISFMAGMGIIGGVDDGIFEPEKDVSFGEAVKVIVGILGYNKLAESEGGYPLGHLQVASRLGMMKGISANAEDIVTRGLVIRLICNSLEVPIYKITKIEDGSMQMEADKEDTFLSYYQQIYIEQGFMSANSRYDINVDDNPLDGSVKVNGRVMKIDYAPYEEFVGDYVKCYYRNDNLEQQDKALYIYKIEKRSETLIINGEDIESVGNHRLCYNIDGRKRYAAVLSNATIIYNDAHMGTFSEKDLIPKNGFIKLADMNGDGLYELIIISSYYNMIAEKCTKDRLYSKFKQQKNLDMTLDVFIVDEKGIRLQPEDIKTGMVVSVFESQDSKRFRLVVSQQTVTGEVTEVSRENNLSVIIGGNSYKVDDDFVNTENLSITPKTSAVFYLDYIGKIFSMSVSASGKSQIGYFIKKSGKSSGLSMQTQIKLMESSGKISVKNIANKVNIDGVSYNQNELESENLLPVLPQPVLYRLNNEDEITMLDTLEEEAGNDDDRLNLTFNGVTGRWSSTSSTFEGYMPVDRKAQVFVVPAAADFDNETDFLAGSTSMLVNGRTYKNIMAYSIYNEKMTADIIVINKGDSKGAGNFGLVMKIAAAMNESGENVDAITVMDSSGTERRLLTKKLEVLGNPQRLAGFAYLQPLDTSYAQGRPVKLSIGDVIFYFTDERDLITDIGMVYDEDEHKMLGSNPYHGDYFGGDERYVYAQVMEKYDTFIKLKSTSVEYWDLGVANVKIFIYDSEQKKLVESSISEINSYKDYSEKASNVLMFSANAYVRCVYMFK